MDDLMSDSEKHTALADDTTRPSFLLTSLLVYTQLRSRGKYFGVD